MKNLLIAVFIFSCQALMASEKWESLGDGFFVDKASQELRGDIGQIDFRGAEAIVIIKVDCKRDVIISPAQFIGRVVQPNSIMQTVIKRACQKKWYQVLGK